MNVETGMYKRSHGKSPRGYGFWFFGFEAADGTKESLSFHGKYSEAKQKAIRYAKSEGYVRVQVLP